MLSVPLALASGSNGSYVSSASTRSWRGCELELERRRLLLLLLVAGEIDASGTK